MPSASAVLPLWPGLPRTTPMSDLPKPTVQRSTLAASGLRVASQETYGQLCNFGVFVDAGSRCEAPGGAGSRGATHLTELMAFKSTHKRCARGGGVVSNCYSD
jgi:predicted Zn-dependent peptidase